MEIKYIHRGGIVPAKSSSTNFDIAIILHTKKLPSKNIGLTPQSPKPKIFFTTTKPLYQTYCIGTTSTNITLGGRSNSQRSKSPSSKWRSFTNLNQPPPKDFSSGLRPAVISLHL